MKNLILLLAVLTACTRSSGPNEIVKINLIDQHGMNETIQAKDRLARYQEIDFTRPQPYEKVMRIYPKGRSIVTSYYPSGQIQQRLEVADGRACGTYQEWHPTGSLKLEGQVIGGSADIDPSSVLTYIFDGETLVYDEEGNVTANIPYKKGSLEGLSVYFYPNGVVQKEIPYVKGKTEGRVREFYPDGSLRMQAEHLDGEPHGAVSSYWPSGHLASGESYEGGLLRKGVYYDDEGNGVSNVLAGEGRRAVFRDDGIVEMHEYSNGIAEGRVEEFGKRGEILRSYRIHRGQMHGEEIEYYPLPPFAETASVQTRPKISLHWHKGEIQGVVKTWYPNGRLESQREVSRNRKSGLSMAWYTDGSLMLMEEYRADQLVRGEYFQRGISTPASKVVNGKGTATLYDPEGNLIKRIAYLEGHPSHD